MTSTSEYLQANRELLNLSHARLFLATRARARTPLGATEFLGATYTHQRDTYDKRIGILLDCMEVYRAAFPQEYARSSAPFFSTQREHEFYRLVHTTFFPLIVTIDEQPDHILTHLDENPFVFLPFIPMRGIQRNVWAPGRFDFKQVGIAFQVALTLSREFARSPEDLTHWEALRTRYGLDCPAPLEPFAAVGWTLFVHSLAVEDSPLKWLAIAFNMIAYKTNNPWLDLPPIGYTGIEWSIPQVMRLHMMKANADDQYLALDALDNWFNEDPKARIARAVEIWNDAATKEQQQGMGGVMIEDMIDAGNAIALGDGVMALRRAVVGAVVGMEVEN